MRIKLLQWNVWYLEDVINLKSLLEEVDADILCLQELTTNSDKNPSINTGSFLAEELGLNLFIKTAQEWKNFDKDSQDNAILTKFPLKKTFSHYLKTPGPPETRNYSEEGRVYVEAAIEINGSLINVGTTHLTFAPHFIQTEVKREEEEELFKVLTKNKSYIFTGDLNSAYDTPLIKKLSQKFQNCGPAYEEKTWTTKEFDYQGFRETELNWRLDYVFASHDLKVLSSKVIKTGFSDHLPILVEFELRI